MIREGIKVKRLGIEPGKEFGWDLTKPNEGYPCINLKDGKCSLHETGKPEMCKTFPYNEEAARRLKTCSYYYIDGQRHGSCNGCVK